MAEDKLKRFTVITNDKFKDESTRASAVDRHRATYQTNPMYEKLLKFKEEQKRKRFTVEDLLKW